MTIAYAWTVQHDYAAIVLMNPPVASKPVELLATVAATSRERSRRGIRRAPRHPTNSSRHNPVVCMMTQQGKPGARPTVATVGRRVLRLLPHRITDVSPGAETPTIRVNAL